MFCVVPSLAATLPHYNKPTVFDRCAVNSYTYKRIQHPHRHDNEKDYGTLINLLNFRRQKFRMHD